MVGEPEPGAPTVRITSPEALEHPDDGPVLVDDEVVVVCEAVRSSMRGSDDVNPESVILEMLDADGEVVGEAKRGVPNGNDDEYATMFVLTGLENGVVSFRCTASDVASPPRMGTATISTLVDRGPIITIISPEEDSIRPQMGAARFAFTVEPSPLVRGDDGAAVGDVTLRVANVNILLEEETPGTYVANVDFTDMARFGAPLEGSIPVVIQAANVRTDPGPVTRTRGYNIIVDGEGPTIDITNPPNQVVLGGSITLSFTVADEFAQVDPASIVVTINTQDHRYMEDPSAWAPVMGANYRFTFNSRLIQDSVTQAFISVRAQDRAQNAARTASLILFLDNVPPIVDMDPANIREKRGSGPGLQCSHAFDPLGVSPNDVAVVHEALPVLRTFVWDQTNGLTDAMPRASKTDQDTVYVYLQRNPNEPIIMDGEDTDDICDRINPAITQPQPIQLRAIGRAGNALFGPQGTDPSPDPPIGTCPYGLEQGPHDKLCSNQVSDLSRVTQYGLDITEPVVYGIGDLREPVCTGDYLEVHQLTGGEGWFCLASVAVDNVGNAAVSRPLRLCLDDTRTTAQPSCIDLQNPPTCTDGCTLPPTFADRSDRIITISNQ